MPGHPRSRRRRTISTTSGPTRRGQPGPGGVLAPRLQNLGAHTFKVTTRSSRAQQFINQGLNLTYGFNHAEAGRAFAEAARLDPSCAMAYWGQALVLGPNINAAMAPDDEPKALALVQKALSLARGVTPRERDYIDALAKRYTGKADGRQAADRAFADAMRALTKKYPRDLDAATHLRRVADGPASVELLDARRAAARGDRRGHRRARARDRGESEASRGAALLDSPVGADEDSRARREGGRPPAAR